MAADSLYTLLDIATEVGQSCGDVSDLGLAKAKKWVNRALLMVAELGDWTWMLYQDASISTVSGTETYELASDVKKVLAIYIQDSARRKLRLIDNRRFREIYTQATTPQGNPLYYRHAARSADGDRQISLYPVPNAVLTLKYDYIKEMTLLVNNTDDVRTVCGMPAYMVDALIQLAIAIGSKEIDDSDYASLMEEAVARWNRLYQEDSSEIDDSIRASAFGGDSNYYNDPILPPRYGDVV